jgi:hypothetical protein
MNLQMTAMVRGYLQEGEVAVTAIQTYQHYRRQNRPVGCNKLIRLLHLMRRVKKSFNNPFFRFKFTLQVDASVEDLVHTDPYRSCTL